MRTKAIETNKNEEAIETNKKEYNKIKLELIEEGIPFYILKEKILFTLKERREEKRLLRRIKKYIKRNKNNFKTY